MESAICNDSYFIDNPQLDGKSVQIADYRGNVVKAVSPVVTSICGPPSLEHDATVR